MAQTYWFLMALDYLFLNILSYNTIENYLLDRYAFPVRSYYPLYSELFSIESILLYMIIAGAALAMKANQNSDSQQASHFTGHLAIFFAVLAVPARLMTRGLIDCDTLYFAFVMFFSSLLLYGSVRNGLNIKPRMSFKKFAKVFAVLALLFWFLEPSSEQALQTFAETETTQPAPVKQPASLTASPSDVSSSTARVDTPGGLQLRPEPDGLEMILGSGADVKSYRENQQNIFHFLAENWRAQSDNYRTYNVDFASVFARAIKRKLTLDKKDKRGLTPLWAALQANNLRPFIRFLEAGADRSAYNTEGLTLIEFCNKNNRKILLGLLTDLRPHEK
ncbi:MAG: hypothetical protein KKB51_17445 [Candidatus Riflebacteria bacterium]|nr:hypothetical protein [Candidatus Riflebacteria bacterium]